MVYDLKSLVFFKVSSELLLLFGEMSQHKSGRLLMLKITCIIQKYDITCRIK